MQKGDKLVAHSRRGIDINPTRQIRATAPFSAVTTSISGLSIRSILLPSNGIPSFLPRCRRVFSTDISETATAKMIWQEYGHNRTGGNTSAVKYLARNAQLVPTGLGNIWADACPNTGR